MAAFFVYITISFFLIIGAYILTRIVTPFIILKALRWKLLDAPNGRKVHRYSKPRVGGLAMFFVYVLILGCYVLATKLIPAFSSLKINIVTIYALILGSVLITFFGFLDDLFGIRAIYKLIIQILIAYLTASNIIGFGINVQEVSFLQGWIWNFGIFTVPLTVCWIVFVMNAINLIDGLDGLAAGISGIAAFFLGVSAIFFGNFQTAMVLFILFAILMGFLRYNFNPAKVFMGDSGSLFLGYNISVLSILAVYNTPRVFVFTIPLLLLGIPIYDVITSIYRRIKHKKPIFAADGQHVHHRIMALGFTHKQTVLVIYIESIFLAVAASIMLLFDSNISIIIFIILCILILLSTEYLKKLYRQ